MASKEEKLDIRNAKRSANKMRKGQLRLSSSASKTINKVERISKREGTRPAQIKTTSSSSRFSKTNSAKQPSMPVKQGAKNKMKAQGARTMSQGIRYTRTKYRGK